MTQRILRQPVCECEIYKDLLAFKIEIFDSVFFLFNLVQHVNDALKILPYCMKIQLLKVECLAFLGRYQVKFREFFVLFFYCDILSLNFSIFFRMRLK